MSKIQEYISANMVKERWLTIDGYKFFVKEYGSGQPALFVHGHGSSHQMWTKLIKSKFSKGFRCISYDQPGNGRSDKPSHNWYTLGNYSRVLEVICKEFELKDAYVISHSLGAMATLNSLSNISVKKLVLISPPIKGDFLSYLDFTSILKSVIDASWLARTYQSYMKFKFLTLPFGMRTLYGIKILQTEVFERCYQELKACTPGSLYGAFRVLRTGDVREQLPGIEIPTLIIAGQQDRIVPKSQAELAAKLIPGAELMLVDKCGHLPTDEKAEEVFAKIREFVR